MIYYSLCAGYNSETQTKLLDPVINEEEFTIQWQQRVEPLLPRFCKYSFAHP